MNNFIEGFVRYPDTLPCPQVDTDLVPRERRYISDITDVRNMRMFQQEFQATRNRISFIFTEEEAREFREWYTTDIIHGGAWFYADWPTLHKDKNIAHRFVGQPKYEWLLGANPGVMGRQIGRGGAVNAVALYKVTATVELYEPRKVGKTSNTYTSKIYPYCFADTLSSKNSVRGMPFAKSEDDIKATHISIKRVSVTKWIYSDYAFQDDITASQITIPSANLTRWIYSDYAFKDDAIASQIQVSWHETKRLIGYTYFEDDVTSSNISILSGEKK